MVAVIDATDWSGLLPKIAFLLPAAVNNSLPLHPQAFGFSL
jgi:hypothetical protein